MSEPITVKVNPEFIGGKTIRQIAAELGVSKQAVHQKRKSSTLSTALRPFTSTVDDNLRVNDRKQVDGSFTVVYAMIDALKEQLSSKDKVIAEQQQTIRELTAALMSAQESARTAQQTAQAA